MCLLSTFVWVWVKVFSLSVSSSSSLHLPDYCMCIHLLYESVLYSVNIFMLNHVQLSTVSLVDVIGSLHLFVSNYLSLHLSLFEDVQFWRSRKSLEGLSVRSVFFNVFQSVIVLLYILDNETNTMVIIMVFIGLCIDIWKVTKVTTVTLDRNNLIAGVLPRLTSLLMYNLLQRNMIRFAMMKHSVCVCTCAKCVE